MASSAAALPLTGKLQRLDCWACGCLVNDWLVLHTLLVLYASRSNSAHGPCPSRRAGSKTPARTIIHLRGLSHHLLVRQEAS